MPRKAPGDKAVSRRSKSPVKTEDAVAKTPPKSPKSPKSPNQTDEVAAPAPTPAPAETPRMKFFTRVVMSLAMGAFCIMLIHAGHFYIIVCGILVQIECFREMVNVRYDEGMGKQMPLFRTLQWSWFLVAMFYVHGDILHQWGLKQDMTWVLQFTQYKNISSFCLYCAVMIATILTLRRKLLRYQFSQLMWTMLTIGLVVFQYKFFVQNIVNGLFWWMYPSLLVITNDCTAYLCGMSMGKKFIKSPFLPLSPNKTWEGFLGAGLCTIAFSFYLPTLLNYIFETWGSTSNLYCPVTYDKMSINPFDVPAIDCDIPDAFVYQDYTFPLGLGLGDWTINMMPIQLHGLMYGLFASAVAPFGGFLASAIKRAYDLKDFESILPGHGGIMDRVDCHMIMMAYTYMHYTTFFESARAIDRVFTAAMRLTADEEMALLKRIQTHRVN